MKTGKKDLIKVIAVAAAGVIAGTGVTAAAFGTANKTEDAENTSAASSQAAETTEQKKPSKDETVYKLGVSQSPNSALYYSPDTVFD